MPARYELCWVPSSRQWIKRYRGKRYAVSVYQLSRWAGRPVPETKEGSYQTANAWWAQKKLEIDSQAASIPHRDQADIDECMRRAGWCLANGDHEGAARWSTFAKHIGGFGGNESFHDVIRHNSAAATLMDAGLDVERPMELPTSLVSKLSGDDVWADRLKDQAQVPEDQTIGGTIDLYEKLLRSKVDLGQSAKALSNTVDCLNAFREQVGAGLPIDKIGPTLWEGFYLWLVGEIKKGRWGTAHAGKVFVSARAYIEWLAESGMIEEPKNLRSRNFRFRRAVKAVAVISTEEVRTLIDRASGQLKLHLLLMANTGMTQQDVSDLNPSEVDWTEGRIIRKRSKTKGQTNAPVVDYKLWDETFTLLKRFRSSDPERVLLTSSGKLWVSHQLVDGKLKSTDSHRSIYTRLTAKLKAEGKATYPSKLLRKTSASLLGNHPIYGRYAQYFLGHAPTSIAERHYVKPSRELFDEAIQWLGLQYGFIKE